MEHAVCLFSNLLDFVEILKRIYCLDLKKSQILTKLNPSNMDIVTVRIFLNIFVFITR